MSTNQDVACPTITRFQLWDPQFLKELVKDLYDHLTRTLKYEPNEDGVFQNKCAHKKCSRDCWDESKRFLTSRGLNAETVIDMLNTDFHFFPSCERDLIHTYRLEEVLGEIHYRQALPLGNGNGIDPQKWANGGNSDAVLKITNPDNPDHFSFGQTFFLYKLNRGNSGWILNDVKKAYGIARRTADISYTFLPSLVVSCLITATTEIGVQITNDWLYADAQGTNADYCYVLNLDLMNGKWSLEGQKYDHGIFLVDEWEIKGMRPKGSTPVEVYGVLNKLFERK